jgi:hypothetical protein
VIEAVQAMISRDPHGASAPKVSVTADTPGIQARRTLKLWMERETA